MSNPATPRGFRHIGSVLPAGMTGQMREYRVASGHASNIFQGDAVSLTAAGTIQAAAAGAAIRGIVQGFRWVATDGTPRVSPFWPANTVTLGGRDAVAMVIDDPNAEVEARFMGATVPTTADIGLLYDLTAATAGSTATGLSGQGVDSTSGATTLKQFRFLGFVERPDNFTALVNAVGRFVPVNHDFRLQTGV